MALHIRELCKRLKSKQGFVLVYALIALVLSMLVINKIKNATSESEITRILHTAREEEL